MPPLKGTNASKLLASQRYHPLQAVRDAVGAVYELPKKRSGIPIAPSETESAAGRDDAKRPPPSPMRGDCREFLEGGWGAIDWIEVYGQK